MNRPHMENIGPPPALTFVADSFPFPKWIIDMFLKRSLTLAEMNVALFLGRVTSGSAESPSAVAPSAIEHETGFCLSEVVLALSQLKLKGAIFMGREAGATVVGLYLGGPRDGRGAAVRWDSNLRIL